MKVNEIITEADLSRRGFLKGMGAAAVGAAAVGAAGFGAAEKAMADVPRQMKNIAFTDAQRNPNGNWTTLDKKMPLMYGPSNPSTDITIILPDKGDTTIHFNTLMKPGETDATNDEPDKKFIMFLSDGKDMILRWYLKPINFKTPDGKKLIAYQFMTAPSDWARKGWGYQYSFLAPTELMFSKQDTSGTLSKQDTSSQQFYVQLGSFSDKNNADRLQLKLSDIKINDTKIIPNNNLYNVVYGPFPTKEMASQSAQAFQKNGYDAIVKAY